MKKKINKKTKVLYIQYSELSLYCIFVRHLNEKYFTLTRCMYSYIYIYVCVCVYLYEYINFTFYDICVYST